MPLFEVIDLFDDETARSGPEQMALDEALLEIAQRPLLRVYRWAEPTVSFGYSQSLAAVRRPFPRSALRAQMDGRRNRRARLDDWTFALLVPSSEPLARARPIQAYQLDSFRRRGGANEDRLRGASRRTGRLRRMASPASPLRRS